VLHLLETVLYRKMITILKWLITKLTVLNCHKLYDYFIFTSMVNVVVIIDIWQRLSLLFHHCQDSGAHFRQLCLILATSRLINFSEIKAIASHEVLHMNKPYQDFIFFSAIHVKVIRSNFKYHILTFSLATVFLPSGANWTTKSLIVLLLWEQT
jgi:hypothetical protein